MKQSDQNLTAGLFSEADIISRYSRAQAIEDGYLADISLLAKEAGFKFPVAISAGIVALINAAVEHGGKDWNGVVWDILNVLHFNIRKAGSDARLDFSVLIWSKFTRKDHLQQMYSVVGPGDDMAPVITIMLPIED